MLENYRKLENGVIEQIKKEEFLYDEEYIQRCILTTDDMHYLRYGYMHGVIGHKLNSILDIGYGDAGFLKVCQKNIKECYGNDISGHPLPENIKFLTFEQSIDIEVDVITFFDCLEHFHDISFVKNLKAKYIVISLPNCHYFSDEWFEKWKHRKPNEHLWHFNEESLKNFMNEMGYDTLNISNIEDMLRVSNKIESNILSGIFIKRTKI